MNTCFNVNLLGVQSLLHDYVEFKENIINNEREFRISREGIGGIGFEVEGTVSW